MDYKSHPERLPSKDECELDIYGLIIERCAFRSQYNIGSINVERLPTRPSARFADDGGVSEIHYGAGSALILSDTGCLRICLSRVMPRSCR